MVQRFDVGARLSEMAVHNGVAYLAGQVANDGTQDITGQTAQVLCDLGVDWAQGHYFARPSLAGGVEID